VRCDLVAERLPAAVDDDAALDTAQASHVAHCLRCQAELAQYRRLRRTMAAMATQRHSLPADLATDVLVGLDDALDRRARQRTVGRRAAYLGGLAAATAAGVGGVLVLTTRRRPA
jgi:anti-sigma factor RsiW